MTGRLVRGGQSRRHCAAVWLSLAALAISLVLLVSASEPTADGTTSSTQVAP